MSRNDREPEAVFCVVPGETEAAVTAQVEARFERDRTVTVVRERRHRERRARLRRIRHARGPTGERRQVRNPNGRRVDDRRRAVVERPLPDGLDLLPARVRVEAHAAGEEKRLAVADSLRLVIQFQAGDPDAFRAIYQRHFDGVYGYLLTALRDRHDAEDGAQEVFIRVLRALPEYEFRGTPFEAWLYRVVRNHTLNVKERSAPVSPADPASIDLWRDNRDRRGLASGDASSTDHHLLVYVERLPASQRQVLVLRYMVGLGWTDIATVLGRSPGAVRQLEQRALTFLRKRLDATQRSGAARRQTLPMRRRSARSPVAASRRGALIAS